VLYQSKLVNILLQPEITLKNF